MSARAPAQAPPRALTAILRRERRLVLAALLGVSALAWVYLLRMALSMPHLSASGAMPSPSWDGAYFVAMLVMWIVMMAGMMLPSAAPAVLLYATIAGRCGGAPATYRNTAFFAAGYLAVWSAFSLVATLAQWTFSETELLSPAMASTSNAFSGLLFLAAAAYQLTPLKQACLTHCRSPIEFLARRRPGRRGALRVGLEHGAYCLGCCWVLMALLFALGVMNLLWVAVLAAFVLAEKAFPGGAWIGRLGGAVSAGVGAWLLVTP